tara:strand:+ start:803 stop:934 length:132 start_codon:yes stop_codon:yes gene_type:complete
MRFFKIKGISDFGGFLKVENRPKVRAMSDSGRHIGCLEIAKIR